MSASRAVFNGLRECSLLKRLGDKQKRGRWFSRSIKLRSQYEDLPILLLFCLYIVTTRGTVQFKDIPYVGGILAGLPPSKLAAAVADDDDDLLIAVPKDPVVEKAVKDSSFACGVDRKNALSFVTCSLANFTTTKLILSMAH